MLPSKSSLHICKICYLLNLNGSSDVYLLILNYPQGSCYDLLCYDSYCYDSPLDRCYDVCYYLVTMRTCLLDTCKKDISSLPAKARFCSTAHKMQFHRLNSKEETRQEKKEKVIKEVEKKITEIPEEELNYFYRGAEGKLRLAYDEVHALYFNSGPVIYTEKERVRILQEKMKGIK